MTFQGHIKGQNGKSSKIFFFTLHIFYTLQNHFRSTIKKSEFLEFFYFSILILGKNITPVVIIASDAIPYV